MCIILITRPEEDYFQNNLNKKVCSRERLGKYLLNKLFQNGNAMDHKQQILKDD